MSLERSKPLHIECCSNCMLQRGSRASKELVAVAIEAMQ